VRGKIVVEERAAEQDNGRGRDRVMAPANLAAARGRRRLRFWAAKHKVERPRRCSNRDVTGCEKDARCGKCERKRERKKEGLEIHGFHRWKMYLGGLYTPLLLFLSS